MLKSEAAAYLAGVTQTEGAEASAPTNLHIITGEVGETSENGKALIKIDGLIFSESDDQYIEIDALGGLEEGDIATLILAGEQGHGMTPLAIGSIGSVDRITVRIAAIEADYIKVEQLDAAEARIGELEADHVSVDDLNAATARIGTLETTRATITELEAATARIHSLEVDHVSIDDFEAEQANIDQLQANTADIGTIRANSAKVQNLTAAQLEADHATVGSLSTNYAHITNGVIDNATIGYADVNNLSAHYAEIQNGKIDSALINTAAIVDEQVFTVTGNKATLAQIDASKINVLNLKAQNIEVERINGQPVTNKTLVDALSQHESDISDLDSKIDDEVEALNERIDGAIETFTGTVVPTLNNTPASQWNTVALKDQHVGDVYYVVNSQSAQNGYCYRFTKSGSTYSWQLIKDSDVTAALSRLQTAEGKIGDIETFDETVGSFMTNTNDEISSLKTKDTQLETSLGDKVSTSTFNTVSQKVTANEANITSMSTVLTNNGLTSSTNITNTVNTVRQTAETNTSSISSLTQTVNNKADSTTVTTLTNRVSTAEQNLSGITTRVGKTESELDTVSNPNLSPFFSFALDNYYNASSNPDGYWDNSKASYGTNLSDGWAHLSKNNAGGSTTTWFTIYEHSAWRHAHGDLKGSTKYTVMIEFRNVTKSGNVTCIGTCTHASSWPSMFVGNSDKGDVAVADGVQYHIGTTVADPSSVTGSTCTTRTLIIIPAGASIDCDIRVSLYEGEYSGPYKPYVDQTLSNRVKSAETSIEQNTTAISLRATKAEASQMAQPNLSPYFSACQNTDFFTNSNYPIISSELGTIGTQLSDGWLHVDMDNSARSAAAYLNTWLKKPSWAKNSTEYTWLIEVRNFTLTSGSYIRFSPAQNNSAAQTNVTGYIDVTANDSYYVKSTTKSDATTNSAYTTFSRGLMQANAGVNASFDVRYSVYEGDYSGPYKPYGGDGFYATSAELKVQTDRIGMVVSNADTSSSLALTTNAMEYIGNHVEIKGTDGTSTVISGGRIQANSLTIGAFDSSTQGDILNSNVQVGGRNLLPQTQNWGKVSTSNGTGTITSDTKAGCQILKFVWGSGNADVFFTGKWTRPLEANTWYILSFWARADAAVDLRNYLWSPAVVDNGQNSVGITTSSADGAILTPITTSWERYWIAWHVKAGSSLPNNVMIGRLQSAGTVYFAGAKFEKGNKATDWTPAPEDQIAYVDSIQVGGRNLFAESQTLPTSKWTYENGATRGDNLANLAANVNSRVYQMPANGYWSWEANTEYVVSVEAKASASGGKITFNMVGAGSGVQTTVDITTEWKRYSWAFVSGSTVSTGSASICNSTTTGTVQVRKPKLEKGNKATDWSPAPEDQTAYVNEATYQSSQPNLSPFFTMPLNDVYSSDNTNGYWDNNKSMSSSGAVVLEQLSDGWAHYNYSNTDTNTRWLTIYEIGSWRHLAGDLKGNTKYTVLMEFRNVTKSGNVTCIGTTQYATSWPSMFVGNSSLGNVAVADGSQYHVGTTIADPSSVADSTHCTTRTLITIPAGASITCDLRVSLYEGEYTGPYKPYSGDMLFATNTALAGTNESLEGAIEDIGELSDQLVGTVTEQNKTITDIQTYLNSLRKDLDAEIQSRQQWLNFNSAEGLVIGAAGSSFKTVTTNTSQQFRSGGTVLAETSGTEFVAPVMRSNQLLIGNWMWTRRDNGNLSLKWIG